MYWPTLSLSNATWRLPEIALELSSLNVLLTTIVGTFGVHDFPP